MSTEPNFDRPLKPITEFITRPDFPDCLRGEFVDIGGYTGIVTDVTSKSIKVRSPEETTRSFNVHALRKLYGPPQHPEPLGPAGATMSFTVPEKKEEAPEPAPERDTRELIAQPNFEQPARAIAEFAGRADFPSCIYGKHVEISGFSGVAVQVANESVKVRSPQGIIRSYGVSTLRKLFGRR